MNKYTEPFVSEWENRAHVAAVNNQHEAFSFAVKMRNFNACSVLRLAIVADQLKKYRGY